MLPWVGSDVASPNALKDMANFRFQDAVIDMYAVALGGDDPAASHLGQVLGHDRLRHAEFLLDLRHCGFAGLQDLYDLEPLGMAQQFDRVGGPRQGFRIDTPEQGLLSCVWHVGIE
jgi:hypothetical protein